MYRQPMASDDQSCNASNLQAPWERGSRLAAAEGVVAAVGVVAAAAARELRGT